MLLGLIQISDNLAANILCGCRPPRYFDALITNNLGSKCESLYRIHPFEQILDSASICSGRWVS